VARGSKPGGVGRDGLDGQIDAVPVAHGSNGVRFCQEGDAVNTGIASAVQKVRE
jgi:hypothetical protein